MIGVVGEVGEVVYTCFLVNYDRGGGSDTELVGVMVVVVGVVEVVGVVVGVVVRFNIYLLYLNCHFWHRNRTELECTAVKQSLERPCHQCFHTKRPEIMLNCLQL